MVNKSCRGGRQRRRSDLKVTAGREPEAIEGTVILKRKTRDEERY